MKKIIAIITLVLSMFAASADVKYNNKRCIVVSENGFARKMTLEEAEERLVVVTDLENQMNTSIRKLSKNIYDLQNYINKLSRARDKIIDGTMDMEGHDPVELLARVNEAIDKCSNSIMATNNTIAKLNYYAKQEAEARESLTKYIAELKK